MDERTIKIYQNEYKNTLHDIEIYKKHVSKGVYGSDKRLLEAQNNLRVLTGQMVTQKIPIPKKYIQDRDSTKFVSVGPEGDKHAIPVDWLH